MRAVPPAPMRFASRHSALTSLVGSSRATMAASKLSIRCLLSSTREGEGARPVLARKLRPKKALAIYLLRVWGGVKPAWEKRRARAGVAPGARRTAQGVLTVY